MSSFQEFPAALGLGWGSAALMRPHVLLPGLHPPALFIFPSMLPTPLLLPAPPLDSPTPPLLGLASSTPSFPPPSPGARLSLEQWRGMGHLVGLSGFLGHPLSCLS